MWFTFFWHEASAHTAAVASGSTKQLGSPHGKRTDPAALRKSQMKTEGERSMSRRRGRRRRLSRNEKIFYFLSLLIALSMVLSLVYVAITPGA